MKEEASSAVVHEHRWGCGLCVGLQLALTLLRVRVRIVKSFSQVINASNKARCMLLYVRPPKPFKVRILRLDTNAM